MPMLHDAAALPTGFRTTAAGYAVGRCKAAKVNNIQVYGSAELGLPGPHREVRIFRPREVVADRASLASLAHRVVTLTHPSDGMTNSETFKRDAVGWTGSNVSVAEDGEHIVVDLLLADADCIREVTSGRATQVSCGYSADISWTPGRTSTGAAYDGALQSVRYNHLSVVPAGRAGGSTTLGDVHPKTGAIDMNTIIIDGQQITADARIVAEVERLQGRVAFYDSLAARAGIPADQLPALIADAVGRHRDLVAHQAKVDRFQAGIRARGGICA